MERTDRGRQVREYFIAAEKTLRGIVSGEIALPATFSPIADLTSKIAAFQITSPEGVRTYAAMLALQAKLTGAPDQAFAIETEADPVAEDLAALIAAVVEAGEGESEIVVALENLLRCAHDQRLLGWCIPRRLRPNWQIDRRTQSAFGKLVASRIVGRRFQTPKGEYLAARADSSRRSSIALLRRN